MSTISFICLILSVLISFVIPVLFTGIYLYLKKIKFGPFLKGLLIYLLFKFTVIPFVLNSVLMTFQTYSIQMQMMALTIFLSLSEVFLLFLIYKYVVCIESDQKRRSMLGYRYAFGFVITIGSTCFNNLVIADHIRVGKYLTDTLNLSSTALQDVIYNYTNANGLALLAVGFQSLIMIVLYVILFKYYDRFLQEKKGKWLFFGLCLLLISNSIIYLGNQMSETVLFACTFTFGMMLVYLYHKKKGIMDHVRI